jgi:pyruvyltransferase
MIRTHWWRGEGLGREVENWGDRLGPLILRHFAGIKGGIRWTPFGEAEVVTVGSILQLMPPHWPGIIAGCGKIRADSPFKPGPLTRIMALRGPLTARGIPGNYALGDPGLLADELLPELPQREFALGLLPHWSDTQLERRPEFLKYKPLIIRPEWDPMIVIRDIGRCRKLVTSSLHGVIVADAFGIPRRIEEMGLTRLDTTFKFRDYCASVRSSYVPGVTSSPKYQYVEERKHSIWDVYRELGMILQ